MDPNENLAAQLQLSARLLWQAENDKPISSDDVAKLAELVICLDEWRRAGGFDPYVSSAPMPL